MRPMIAIRVLLCHPWTIVDRLARADAGKQFVMLVLIHINS
jgi:hypothetical protein